MDPEFVTEGANALKPIARVYDSAGEELPDTPQFCQVFASVESAPGAGGMHTVLLDADGNTYTTGSNGRRQLCLGNVVERQLPRLRHQLPGAARTRKCGERHQLAG